MRITNGMMINNSLNNISRNKRLSDKLNTQLATTKKIQRPSEDPIVAIRALRLRSTYNEIEQYLEKNIPDARSWMEATQEAVESINSVLTEISGYCNQGVNGYETVEERSTLVTTLKQLRDQIYADGDADLIGRTLFTGHKTNSTLTFQDKEEDTKYSITQKFNVDDLVNASRIHGIDIENVEAVAASEVKNHEHHIMYLAYDDVVLDSESENTITIDGVSYTVEERSKSDNDVYAEIAADSVAYVKETGELLLGENAFKAVVEGGEVTVNYEKTGFDKGELRPEHYFKCTNETKGVSYEIEDQPIRYTINFNQQMTINTQAQNVLPHAISRDLDDIINNVVVAVDVQTKIQSLEKRLQTETDEEALKDIKYMLEAAELEFSYAEHNMKEAFSRGITRYKQHQEKLGIELSDIGARLIRLSLNEERLSAQKLNVEELKSKNEEIEQEEVAVEWAAAEAVYDASLATAAKVVQKSLLDFI